MNLTNEPKYGLIRLEVEYVLATAKEVRKMTLHKLYGVWQVDS